MLLYLPFFNQPSRIITYKFDENEFSKINEIRKWALLQNPSLDTSAHWWFSKLPDEIKNCYRELVLHQSLIDTIRNKFGDYYDIDCLFEMNEVYISPPSKIGETQKKSSDLVFYTRHLDGPYYYYPFASCYRTIIGLDNNEEIKTVFPLVPYEQTLKKGEVISFDYHRESHYIIKRENCYNNDYRAVLKVHYCIYPRWFSYFGKILGKLTINYNYNFRNLFLFTIEPQSIFEKITARVVIHTTKIYNDIELYIGYNNISFVLLSLLVSDLLIYLIIPMRLLTATEYNPIFVRDCSFYGLLYLFIAIKMIIYNNYSK